MGLLSWWKDRREKKLRDDLLDWVTEWLLTQEPVVMRILKRTTDVYPMPESPYAPEMAGFYREVAGCALNEFLENIVAPGNRETAVDAIRSSRSGRQFRKKIQKLVGPEEREEFEILMLFAWQCLDIARMFDQGKFAEQSA